MSDEFKIIKGYLDVTKINKARLFTKEGKPGKYLKIVLIRKRELDQYGQVSFMIKEDVSQREREAGLEGNFIGDASILKPKGNRPSTSKPAPTKPDDTKDDDGDDIPF